MINVRSFANRDIPQIVNLWRSEPSHRALLSAVSATLLEECVFAKLYFDPNGLLLAEQDGVCQGFVHAAFGPDANRRWIDASTGMIAMLMVRPGADEDQIAQVLIRAALEYLERAGVRRIFAGAVAPYDPFYAGLYAGMLPVGILQTDQRRSRWFEAAGFAHNGEVLICQLNAEQLRLVVTRDLLLLRRQCRLETLLDPTPLDWWEANLAAGHDFWMFRALAVASSTPLGEARFCDLEPLGIQWRVAAVELLRLCPTTDPPTPGWNLYLLIEAIKQLHQSGIRLVQWTIPIEDVATRQLAESIGFQVVDQGVYRVWNPNS